MVKRVERMGTKTNSKRAKNAAIAAFFGLNTL